MRAVILAYDGVDGTLTVELSVSEPGPDGVELPLKFAGRTVGRKDPTDDDSLAGFIHQSARVLMDLAIDQYSGSSS